jgi:hypothetical protein
MKARTILIAASVVVTMGAMRELLAQSNELLFGTGKLDVTKSKYSPGPVPKSSTVKWEPFRGGVKLTVDLLPAVGELQHWECSGKFDGRDNEVKGDNANADTMSFSKLSANTYRTVMKKGGKMTLMSQIVVAPDGRTRTTTQTGQNAAGQKVNNTMIYERQ